MFKNIQYYQWVILLVWLGVSAGFAQADRIYVANADDGTISVIDTSSNTVIATIPVVAGAGRFSSMGIEFNPSGTRAYVSESSKISIIDTKTNSVVATVPMDYPGGLVVNPSGTHIYVSNLGNTGIPWSNNVSVINASNNRVVAVIPVGSLPAGISINPSGTRVYVANTNNDNVAVIDTNTNKVVDTIIVGDYPLNVSISPSGTRVYVANYNSSNISVIDTSNNTVIAAIPVGERPISIAFNPSGTIAYVTNRSASVYMSTGTVSVINTSNNTVIATIPVGNEPDGVVTDSLDKFVYVVNTYDDNVSVINTKSKSVEFTIPVGKMPGGAGIFPTVNCNIFTDCLFVITVNKTGNGSISGSGSFTANSTVNLSAIPDAGWVFSGWSPSPCNSSFQMPANDLTCTANFTLKQFNLTVSKTGNGSINGGGSLTGGTTVNLSATPDAGWMFDGWSPSPCNASFQMPATDLSCTAKFSPLIKTLSLSKTGNGQISGGGNFTVGSSVNLNAIPDADWRFGGWSPSPCNSSFQMPATNLSCTANFVEIIGDLQFKSERCPVSQLETFKSCYEEIVFPIGSKVKITLNNNIITNRFEPLDLWAVLQLPINEIFNGELMFRVSNPLKLFEPYQPPKYNGEPFLVNVQSASREDSILEFEVPLHFSGKYIFYALYVTKGKNPLLDGERVWVSNLAMKEITLTDK